MEENENEKPEEKPLVWDEYLLRKWCSSCEEGYYINDKEDSERHKDCCKD
jgi:hypothetical protein